MICTECGNIFEEGHKHKCAGKPPAGKEWKPNISEVTPTEV